MLLQIPTARRTLCECIFAVGCALEPSEVELVRLIVVTTRTRSLNHVVHALKNGPKRKVSLQTVRLLRLRAKQESQTFPGSIAL